ncbi:MAG: stage II sporulation protein D [Clostridia bacterium]|nr:stage II sporulation protein D [Clostridia bacterium]
MRKYAFMAAVLAVAVAVCPAAAFSGRIQPATATVSSSTVAAADTQEQEYIAVMRTVSGEVSEVDMREYLIGCIAAEMPASYHPQALMAQAVASYTYAKRQLKNADRNAEISDSPDEHQGYLDKAERQEKWGGLSAENEAKIAAAVDAVYGNFLVYDGDLALTVYHCFNSGRTQNAQSLWGSEIPYLSSVMSVGDKLSPDYESEYSFSEKEIAQLAKECGISVSGEPENWLGKVERSDDGYVGFVEIGNGKIKGSEIRKKLNLRSNCFEIYYSGGEFIIECVGYGHCVGMSQYGADYMARQGSSWQEILAHYYPGTEIEKTAV